jgi:hypothetical protein
MRDADLWKRLSEYEIDASDAQFLLSARLAEENGWTRDYARRVLDEYKRFVYLACVAGH